LQLVLLGANDAVRPLPTTSQHVPIEDFKKNLTKIVTHPVITAHNPKILLVTPPPLDEIRVTKLDLDYGHPEAQRHSKISANYSEKVREIAKEVPGVVLVDLWQAIMDEAITTAPEFKAGGPWLGDPECGLQGGLAELLPDGLHMNGSAYKVFYKTVLPHIGQEWEGLADEDRSGYVLPDWRVLNPMSIL
jgi:lysophospholipase L1-like esterase